MRPGAVAGMADIFLANAGNVDVRLPARLDLPRACTLADGINGYTLAYGREGICAPTPSIRLASRAL